MRHISGRAVAWCAVIVLALVTGTWADQGTVSIQKVGGLISGTTVSAGANVRFLIHFANTTGQKCDVENGFKLSSPDGATWDSTTIDSIGPIVDGASTWFGPYFNVVYALVSASNDGQGEDTVGVLGSGNPTKANRQMPATWDDSVFAITAWFNGNKSAAGKHICIDSSFFGPGGTWAWNYGTTVITTVYPAWVGLTPSQPYSDGLPGTRTGSGYCFYIYAPLINAVPNSLTFTATKDGTPPAGQTFQVTSTGDSLGDNQNFTLVENSPWLIKSPSSGTTPRTVSVTVNQTGLAVGTYVDSIEITSATAANSPQWVKVTLNVTTPPPTIFTSTGLMSFVGVTGGANPAPQTFIIKNTGGSTLNWTLSKSSTWLNLSPTSGVDSTQITVSPDITGLLTGNYTDTIVITDPAATNSPRRVIVRLNLGSNLPFIVVDSAVNHFVVDLSTGNNLPPRTIHITNGGIGSLTFTTTKSSNRLFSISPDSGTAPQDVVVGFKILGDVAGTTKEDTLWVHSPEATNSPFPVIFHFHFTNTPAILETTRDTIALTTYECSLGLNGVLPKDSFQVMNIGGDNPLLTGLNYHTTYTSVSIDSGYPPFYVVLQAKEVALPPGVYYDTITIGAINAINSPIRVILKYTRSSGDHQPEIATLPDSFTITRQEQMGNVKLTAAVENRYPGCMPWTAESNAPWLSPVTAAGNAHQPVSMLATIDGLTLGIYRDSFMVNAPSASNSPHALKVKIQIWRLHGDLNWSGFVDGTDLTWMVNYLTGAGPGPQPEYVVGDMNCNGVVDGADLALLVAYLTSQLHIICGNP